MRLIKIPTCTVETINLTTATGHTVQVGGQSSLSNVEIVVPDFRDEKDAMWNKLKYGENYDFRAGTRIERIEFPDDNVILYGVTPIDVHRSEIWEGNVYECTIDYFEDTSTWV